MTKRMRPWLASLVLAAGVMFPAAGPASTACAADGGPHATLIVDTRQEVYELCVALNQSSVSGLDLIELAEDQYGLDYVFGYGGRVVCRLHHVPNEEPSDECLEDDDSFWGYWRWDSSGKDWIWSGSGANSTRVVDGDIEGWAYGPGNDGDNHQKPGPGPNGLTQFRACPEREPRENPGGEEDGEEPANPDPSVAPGTDELDNSGSGDGDASSGPSGSNPGSGPNKPKIPGDFPSAEPEPNERLIDSAPDESELTVAPTPETVETELPPSATTAGNEPEEFPLAGALALVATFAMAGVAVLLVRKRAPVQPKE